MNSFLSLLIFLLLFQSSLAVEIKDGKIKDIIKIDKAEIGNVVRYIKDTDNRYYLADGRQNKILIVDDNGNISKEIEIKLSVPERVYSLLDIALLDNEKIYALLLLSKVETPLIDTVTGNTYIKMKPVGAPPGEYGFVELDQRGNIVQEIYKTTMDMEWFSVLGLEEDDYHNLYLCEAQHSDPAWFPHSLRVTWLVFSGESSLKNTSKIVAWTSGDDFGVRLPYGIIITDKGESLTNSGDKVLQRKIKEDNMEGFDLPQELKKRFLFGKDTLENLYFCIDSLIEDKTSKYSKIKKISRYRLENKSLRKNGEFLLKLKKEEFDFGSPFGFYFNREFSVQKNGKILYLNGDKKHIKISEITFN